MVLGIAACLSVSCGGDDESPGLVSTVGGSDTAGTGGGDVSAPGPDTVSPTGDDIAVVEDTGGTNVLGDGPSYECLVQKCELLGCLNQPECVASLDCAGDCETVACAEACLATTSAPFKGVIGNAIECGAANGCFGGGIGLPDCGDGVCAGAESELSCPEDCNVFGDPDKVYTCMQQSCQTGNCPNVPPCDQAMQCVASCQNLECTRGCIEATSGQIRGFIIQLVACAVDATCMPESAGPQCGDGTCELGETMLTCAGDCGTPSEGYVCMLEECQVGNCPNFNGCNNALICIGECESAECTIECIEDGPQQAQELFVEVVGCAVDQGCLPESAGLPEPECGNGTCDPGENLFNCFMDCKPGLEDCGNEQCDGGESPEACPVDCDPTAASCVGSCGQFNQGGPCHCDEACKEFENCCSDYLAQCESSCGDGECDGDAESAETCPQDCSPVWACMVQQCDAGPCAEAPICSGAMVCMAQCADKQCAIDCTEDQPDNNKTFLEPVLDCSAAAGCFGEPPEPECGDGNCDEGETEESCPVDCVVLPTPTPAECMNLECAGDLGACVTDFDCTIALQCVDGCGYDIDCAQGCGTELAPGASALLTTLLTCGSQKGCFDGS